VSAEVVSYRQAITRAIADEMDSDDDVVLLGEDIAAAGGVFKLTEGLLERFGPRRVVDTPISEQAIVGCAIGAAAQGLRPIAEIMFADFAGVCFDQIANQLAKYRYMSGGQVVLPVTLRLANGAGSGLGAQHSQPVENWFLNVAGLKIAVPATPADAYALLRDAIRDPNPVLVFEHKRLLNVTGPLVEPRSASGIGRAHVVRRGEHVTIVATQLMRHFALEAAERLASEGIDVEVIDPRTLMPLDHETIGHSVDHTSRLVVVQECSVPGSWGATVVAQLTGERFESLDAPPLIIAADHTPVPYAAALEAGWMPSVERIVDGVRRTVAY
jgi:pyruvate dehydrogenase E1 component beta subunit